MKFLRLKIYQPHVHYRIPFTLSRRHTYPIPPYSTVIGLICNVLGIKDQNDEKFVKLKELGLAIYGKFESMTKEYIWLRNLSANSHRNRFITIQNRTMDQIPEHPGRQIPTRIDVLENVNLIIYIYHSDEKFIIELKEVFNNPQNRIYPLHLGRAEDWIVFEDSPEEAIRIVDIDKNNKKPFYGKLYYYTWIPDPRPRNKKSKEYPNWFEKDFYPVDYKEFFLKIKGSFHLVTGLYKIEDGFRNFRHIPVKLFEQGEFPFYFGKPFEFITDTEMNIPLFLCKMI
ncbi:MAG: type I-B CRISPR-associated protein Cas5b [bacterium]|nr:type I-B CRISPR-associated protein Cas5b [bacterium]